MHDSLSQFRDALAMRGIIPPDIILTDGAFHRCDADGKNGKNDATYLYRPDDSGGFENHRDGLGWEDWFAKTGRKLTPQENAVRKAQVEETKKQREAEEARRREAAAQKAREIWEAAVPAENHPYLERKGVQPHGTRVHEGNLIIPMRTGKDIHSLQTIHPDGTKRFLSGGRISGCYYSIGKPGKDNVMCIAEGFSTGASVHGATGYPVAIAFNAGNLKPVAEAMRDRFPDIRIILCADDDYRTDGNPGITQATEAARAVSGIVAIPNFGETRPDGTTDFNDLHQAQGLEAVRENIRNTIELADAYGITDDSSKNDPAGTENPEAIIQHLVGLTAVQYAKQRKGAAKKLEIGVGTLDSLVKDARKQQGETDSTPFDDITPWDEPVNPDELLSEIAATIRRFIICEPETIYAATLWTAMTWFMDVVQVAPLAVITAPEKRCGKSQLLFLLGRMACKPLSASNITPAALFRSIDQWQPTLLIDEADAFMRENEELRGLLNCGHTRESAFSIRTVGENHTPTRFNLWGAKALAGIGHLADTLMDRAIVLELRRRLSCEHVEKLRHADAQLFPDIQRKLARFAEDYSDVIQAARPAIPEALHDRAQDNWEPLLAIADVAGGDWPRLARQAAMKITGDESSTQSRGVELLADIQEVFETKRVNRIFTGDLVYALCEDSEKSWSTYNRGGKPITPKQLSRRLSEYGITSKTIRVDYDRKKGFELSQFDDAFARYIPFSPLTPSQIVTSGQSSIDADLDVTIQNVTNSSVTQIVTPKASTGAGCHDVTIKNAISGGAEEKSFENAGFPENDNTVEIDI